MQHILFAAKICIAEIFLYAECIAVEICMLNVFLDVECMLKFVLQKFSMQQKFL